MTIEVVTGHEADAFTEDPPVTRVDVTVTSVEGDVSVSASAAPGGALDFGEVPSDRLLTFEVRGVDASGATVVRGRSVSGIYLPAVEGDVLAVFAQRVGRWARPPREMAGARLGAAAGVLAERYLTLTGGAAPEGDPAALEAYDLLLYGGATSAALPRAAESVVARGDALLLINNAGATWVDLAAGDTLDVAPPAGLTSFAEVAGGRTIEASDGRSFVVGGTRSGPPTAGVLVIEADGSLGAAPLGAARDGAAAAWVEGLGLVVAGGSDSAAGVEALGESAASFTPRPFPPDGTRGAGAAAAGLGEVTLVGGLLAGSPAATRRIAPGCSSDCAAAELAEATLPLGLTGTSAFTLPAGQVLAVGAEAAGGGLTRSFVVDLAAGAVTELPLREPRAGATPLPAPNGTLSLLGGTHPDGTPARTVEVLFPE